MPAWIHYLKFVSNIHKIKTQVSDIEKTKHSRTEIELSENQVHNKSSRNKTKYKHRTQQYK